MNSIEIKNKYDFPYIMYLLKTAHTIADDRLTARIKASGIQSYKPHYLPVLSIIAHCPSTHIELKQICAMNDCCDQSTTKTVQQIQDAGFAGMRRTTADRRIKEIFLTVKGHAIGKEIIEGSGILLEVLFIRNDLSRHEMLGNMLTEFISRNGTQLMGGFSRSEY